MDAICRQAGKQRSHSSLGPSDVWRGSRTRRKTEKPRERGSHPSAGEKEKAQVTVALDFIQKCTKETKADFILLTIFLLALIYGNIFVFLSFTSLR